jgi:hypothetical protein
VYLRVGSVSLTETPDLTTPGLVERRAVGGLHLERVGPVRSVRPDLSAVGPKMASLHQRRIRAPLAARRGRIYYLSEDRKLMAVPVSADPAFHVPKPIFQTRVSAGVNHVRTNYVSSSDGRVS